MAKKGGFLIPYLFIALFSPLFSKEKKNQVLLRFGYHSISPTEFEERMKGSMDFLRDGGSITSYEAEIPQGDIGLSLEYRNQIIPKALVGVGVGRYFLPRLNWKQTDNETTTKGFFEFSYIPISLSGYYALGSLLLGIRGDFYLASLKTEEDKFQGNGLGLQIGAELNWNFSKNIFGILGIGYRIGYIGNFKGNNKEIYAFDMIVGGKRYKLFGAQTSEEYQFSKLLLALFGIQVEDKGTLSLDLSGLEISFAVGFRF